MILYSQAYYNLTSNASKTASMGLAIVTTAVVEFEGHTTVPKFPRAYKFFLLTAEACGGKVQLGEVPRVVLGVSGDMPSLGALSTMGVNILEVIIDQFKMFSPSVIAQQNNAIRQHGLPLAGSLLTYTSVSPACGQIYLTRLIEDLCVTILNLKKN